MKLLIITQSVDIEDPVLGFFHDWILRFAKNFDKVTVICLKKGKNNLPNNVQILSLGKEQGLSKFSYLVNFFRFIFKYIKEYDSVFVHMNEEYVVLGGIFWKLFGKKVFFWRNHKKGSFITRLAVLFSEKVFCTSKQSFTAQFSKTHIMPVGVDTDLFSIKIPINQRGNTLLSLGRIDPVKKIDILADAFAGMGSEDFNLSIVGNSTSKHQAHFDEIVSKLSSLKGKVLFFDSVTHKMTADFYNKNRFFINLTPSGSFDKTIIEAMSSGCLVFTSNEDLFPFLSSFEKVFDLKIDNLRNQIKSAFLIPSEKLTEISNHNRQYVLENHSLDRLFSEFLKFIC